MNYCYDERTATCEIRHTHRMVRDIGPHHRTRWWPSGSWVGLAKVYPILRSSTQFQQPVFYPAAPWCIRCMHISFCRSYCNNNIALTEFPWTIIELLWFCSGAIPPNCHFIYCHSISFTSLLVYCATSCNIICTAVIGVGVFKWGNLWPPWSTADRSSSPASGVQH